MARCLAVAAGARVLDVHAFGAVGDGAALATAPLRRALADAAADGAPVLLPARSVFRSAPLTLGRNVTLRVDGRLVASGASESIKMLVKARSFTDNDCFWSCVRRGGSCRGRGG